MLQQLKEMLAWIKREDCWNVFVNNRITEIRRLTSNCEWRFVPGNKNPADLFSRACSTQELLGTRWWEGLNWLMASPEDWSKQEIQYDENDINSKKRKTVISAIAHVSDNEHVHNGCSTYKKTVRTIGWIYRFKNN